MNMSNGSRVTAILGSVCCLSSPPAAAGIHPALVSWGRLGPSAQRGVPLLRILARALLVLWLMSAFLAPARALEFQGWELLDSGAMASGAAVVYDQANNLHLFVRGTDNAIYARIRDASGVWGDWLYLEGFTLSAPAATFNPATREIHVFVRGTDNGIYQRTRQPDGVWSSWSVIPGGTTEAPGAATDATGTTTLIVQDATTSGIWINDTATGPDICTSKTVEGPGDAIDTRAIFIFDNTQCDSKTLTITIQPLGTNVELCPHWLFFVQGGQPYNAGSWRWTYADDTPVPFCDRLRPGVTYRTKVQVFDGVSLNLTTLFSVVFRSIILEFP